MSGHDGRSRATIFGTGLIGTSLGLALADQGWEIAGWDIDPAHLQASAEMGAVSILLTGPGEVWSGSDLVVLSAPPGAVVEALTGAATDVLVTDVVGVKAPILAAASSLAHFVGGHPMAGREVSGPAAASPSLFRGAPWVLTTDGASAGDLDRMSAIVQSVGALPVRMSAAEHDRAVALVSHLPQILASALIREAGSTSEVLPLVAGGFRDLTRVAASDPSTWTELLVANRVEVGAVLTAFAARIGAWAAAIGEEDVERLSSALTAARDTRVSLSAPTRRVDVALADRPGELAKVGRALQTSAVDVRDLQLRHSPYGGGGILTISVRPADVDPLVRSLEAEDLVVEDQPEP